MKRVLITRSEPGASATASRLSAQGFDPVVAPVLAVTQRTIKVPDGVAATLFTSGNAVMDFPDWLRRRPAFAVGTATATLASSAGFKSVHDARGDARMLAELVRNTISPSDGTLFLPAAKGQGLELADTLRHDGFHVLRRVAYQATGVRSLPFAAEAGLRDRNLHAALFFSGETARHFVRLVRAAGLAETVRDVEAVSISERAAVALTHLPWRRIRAAAKPNQDAMLVLLS